MFLPVFVGWREFPYLGFLTGPNPGFGFFENFSCHIKLTTHFNQNNWIRKGPHTLHKYFTYVCYFLAKNIAKMSGDVPYFRTVPSSPSNDEGLVDEEEPTESMSPVLVSQQQKSVNVDDDEETVLRRRLLEKKLEKEKEKATTTTTKLVDQSKEHAARQRAEEGGEKEQKEKPKREKIVWDRERETKSRHGQTSEKYEQRSRSQSKDLKPSSSSAHHRRRDEPTTHEHQRHHRRDERGVGKTAPSRNHHHHHHRHRQQQETAGNSERRERSNAAAVVANSAADQRKERSANNSSGRSTTTSDEQRIRTTTTTTTSTTYVEEVIVTNVETAPTRKRRHQQVEVDEAVIEQTEVVTITEPTVSPPPPITTGDGEQQQQEHQGLERAKDEEEGDTAKRKALPSRKKFSKFESSPEDEEEDTEEDSSVSEDEHAEVGWPVEAGDEQQQLAMQKDTADEEGGTAGNNRRRIARDDDEQIMEEYFGMDERHFRSRAGTVDTEMNGATTNGEEEDMDIGDEELIENKEFDQLTEEEKALLSPEMLSQKEEKYQRRLVSMLPVYYPGISGCRSVAEYECLNKISEGTFGVVYRAQNKRTDEIVALKRLKMEKEQQGFPITSLREINMLLKCGAHPNIVNVREVVVGSSMDKIYLVMDFVEHDVKALIELMKSRGKKWTIPQVKTLLRQLIAGVLYMHDQYVIHRDLKTSNLLLSHQGILKIGDFGLAREFSDPIKPYTPVVVTLWYRAPELLLGTKLYSTPVDMWSVGCIFAEFLKLEPLFPGRTEIDQMQKIFKEVGTPNEQIWPGCMELPGMKTGIFADTPYNQLRKKFAAELPGDDGFELLNKLLTLNPSKRLDAETAVASRWFSNDPKPAHPSTFPTWPAKSEQNRRPLKEPSVVARAPQQPPPRPAGGFTLRFDAPKF